MARPTLVLYRILLLSVLPCLTLGATLEVPPRGSIQQAIDAALDGDTVVVPPGEYVIQSPLNFNRLLQPGGPGLKNITLRSHVGAEQTILRMVEPPLYLRRASVAIFESGESASSVLEGFSLTGGSGTSHGDIFEYPVGGGILCRSGSSLTIRGCRIIGNRAPHAGGGVFCGGFPPAFLASSNYKSVAWRESFIRTFLERDIPPLGIRIPPTTIRRFWQMLVHYHGQIFNASEIASSLGVNHTTASGYLDILAGTFMVRRLDPWFENIGKRQIKRPKDLLPRYGGYYGSPRQASLRY